MRRMRAMVLLAVLMVSWSCCAICDRSQTIPYLDTTEIGGAAAYRRANDFELSPYYARIDWFEAQSEGTLTVLSGVRTYQQTTEVTCGPASALIVYDYLGGDTSQWDDVLLSALCQDEPGATSLGMLCDIFEALGWKCASGRALSPVSATPELMYRYIDAGFPVIVGWMEWGGHWSVVIGYDTMGTGGYSDDVLIMAEPYDTFDHWQDGYTIVSTDLFLSQWLLESGDADVLSVYAPYLVACPEEIMDDLPDVSDIDHGE